jgi:hypothetical protein
MHDIMKLNYHQDKAHQMKCAFDDIQLAGQLVCVVNYPPPRHHTEKGCPPLPGENQEDSDTIYL